MAEVLTKPSRRIRNMVAKELRLIVKDKVALLLIFLLPAALIGMLWWVTDMSDMGSLNLGGTGDTGGTSGDNETSSGGLFGGGDIVIGLIDLDTTRTYEGEDLSTNFTKYLNQSAELIIYNSTDDLVDTIDVGTAYFDDLIVTPTEAPGFAEGLGHLWLTYPNYGDDLKMVHDPTIGINEEAFSAPLYILPILAGLFSVSAAVIIIKKRKA